jgi:hypothetical protein
MACDQRIKRLWLQHARTVRTDQDGLPQRPSTAIDPDEARDLAANLLQAAEAADGDQFMFEFVAKELNVGDNAGANILLEYRKFRDAQARRG